MLDILTRLGLPAWALPVGLFMAGVAAGHLPTKWYYRAEIAAIERTQALAVAKAASDAAKEQKRADSVSLDFSNRESSDQAEETAKTVTITKWAIRHVKEVANCPSSDLVRLHDAAATGADPESIVFAASKPNGEGQRP